MGFGVDAAPRHWPQAPTVMTCFTGAEAMWAHQRSRRLAMVMLLAVMGPIPGVLRQTPAAADPVDPGQALAPVDNGQVTATITVEEGITISFIDGAITLTGSPGATAEDLNAVSMTI